MQRFFATTIALATIATVCILCGGCLSNSTPYSEGYRDGQVQQFSRKGWIRRSHEGQLALPGLRIRNHQHGGSTGGNIWDFSVEDEERDVLHALENIGGDEIVRLHYRQTIFFNPFLHASGYRVYKVERLKGGQ